MRPQDLLSEEEKNFQPKPVEPQEKKEAGPTYTMPLKNRVNELNLYIALHKNMMEHYLNELSNIERRLNKKE